MSLTASRAGAIQKFPISDFLSPVTSPFPFVILSLRENHVQEHLSGQASSGYRTYGLHKGSWLCIWLKVLGAEVVGYALDPPSEPNNFIAGRLSEHQANGSFMAVSGSGRI